MPPSPSILFTAFERSGDEHAAPVIAELKRRRPDLTIWALGGPAMAAAGATMVETTTLQAAMLAAALAKVWEHQRLLGRLRQWLADKRIDLLVPVDSPAANWSICGLIRRRQPQAKIVHLVAPQMWAWASWRIQKMRRLSDHVLCLLPFEEKWFAARNMPATFVGHPVFEHVSAAPGAGAAADLPGGADGAKLALLPGSRMSEVKANWPTMRTAAQALAQRHPGLCVVVAAADEKGAARMRASGDGAFMPEIRVGQTDAVLAWADVVLVASGTATLQVVAHRKPLVTLYNVARWQWELVGRWVIRTRTFTLPNLISEAAGWGRVVPEYVPHFGAVAPVAAELDRLLSDARVRRQQVAALARVAECFAGHHYAAEAAERMLTLVPERKIAS